MYIKSSVIQDLEFLVPLSLPACMVLAYQGSLEFNSFHLSCEYDFDLSRKIKECFLVEYLVLLEGHSGDFGNAPKMVGKISKSVMQLISIGF